MKNWAGNLTYSAKTIVAPTSLAELQEIVRRSAHVRFVGSRHSFSSVADCDDTLVLMEGFNEISEPVNGTVRVGGGVTYGQLAAFLQPRGFAVHNLASLPHISVVGACATATHGSGRTNGNLATAVLSLKAVIADGSLREFVGEEAKLAAVGLGVLGAIYEVTLRVEPSFEVSQWVYQAMPLDHVLQNFDVVSRLGTSVSLFTHWTDDVIDQVWIKCRQPFDAPDTLFGGTKATRKLHPLSEMDPINCTEQLGVPGPWCDRLPHFKMEFTPSAGEELQSEFFVPLSQAEPAIRSLFALGETLSPLLFVSEIRFIAADDLPNSPAYSQDVVGLHFTWRPMWDEVRVALPMVEATLQSFGARPHWGKLHTMSPEAVKQGYPRLPILANLAHQVDPAGKFVNAFMAPFLS